jgi:hypothetical protein
MGTGTGFSGTSSRRLRGRLSVKRVVGIAVVGASTGGLLAAFACGGTTGREELPPMTGMDAAAPDTSPITYVDRTLPDLGAPTSTVDGGEGGNPWPSCPGFLPVSCGVGSPFYGCPPDAMVVEAGMEVDQEPSVYDDAGNLVIASDASACATYPWMGSVAIDKCTTSQCTFGPGTYSFLPPCNWCADAGNAKSGPGVGRSKYSNCMALWECMQSTGCGASGATACLCGEAGTGECDASGPCAAAEFASLEPSPTDTIAQILAGRYFSYDLTNPVTGNCGGALNFVYRCGEQSNCFADASGF